MINKFIKYTILLIIMAVAFSSCSEVDNQDDKNQVKIDKPTPFIERDEIVDLIVDLELAEAAIKRMATYGENTAKTSEYYYDYMFEKWGITFDEYNDIIDYYSQDPIEMEKIYADVISKLSEMQTKFVHSIKKIKRVNKLYYFYKIFLMPINIMKKFFLITLLLIFTFHLKADDDYQLLSQIKSLSFGSGYGKSGIPVYIYADIKIFKNLYTSPEIYFTYFRDNNYGGNLISGLWRFNYYIDNHININPKFNSYIDIFSKKVGR